MMTTLKVRFDGRVLIPQEPVTLPQDCVLDVTIMEKSLQKQDQQESMEPPLLELVEALKDLPVNPNSPIDGAAQHDHYLYGTPKRP